MKILSAKTAEHQGGIILPDLESVKAALNLFASGITPDSHATKRQLVAAGGGMAATLLDLVQPSPDSFAGWLCAEIETALESRNRYSRHFDYDGVGSFFKTSVDVSKFEGGYTLGLNAAYIGRKAEESLAAHIGANRGLWWSGVSIDIDAARGSEFSIDFKPIADALEGTSFGGHSPEEMAQIIADGYKEDYMDQPMHGGRVQVFSDDSLQANLVIEDMSVASYWDRPFTADGSIVTGDLRRAWDDPNKFAAPQLSITLRSATTDVESLPVLDSAKQATMRELTAELERSFNP